MEITWYLLITSLVVAFGSSFQSGYFMALYNVPQDIVESYINQSIYNRWHQVLTPVQLSTVWSTIASTNQAGKLIACFLAPLLADRFGRKTTLVFASVISIAGILCQYLAKPTDKFLLLAAGRFITGLYNGLVGVIVPLFLIEIAVIPKWRGSVTRTHNVVTMLGTILAILFGIPEILGTQDRWAYLALIPLPLVIAETIWLMMVQESPMYLLQKGRPAQEVQASLRAYIGKKLDDCQESVDQALKRKQKPANGTGSCRMLGRVCKDRVFRQMFLLWLALSLASSFTGGSVTNNYLTSMIAESSMQFSSFDKYSAVIMNAVKIVVVLLALYVIDRVGRKPLLLVSMWVVLVAMTGLSILGFVGHGQRSASAKQATFWTRIVFLFVWTAIQYVVNSTATLVVSETADQRYRAFSLAVFKAAYHLSSILLTVAYPPIARYSEGAGYLFLLLPFALLCIYVTIRCPETMHVDMFKDRAHEKTPLLSGQQVPALDADKDGETSEQLKSKQPVTRLLF